jgi:hypothetical protein
MKRIGLKKSLFVLISGVGFFLILINTAGAENFLQPKTVLFKTTDEKLDKAKEIKADILVPKTFQEGMDFYREAEEMYKNNEEQDEIKIYIKKARKKFQKAIGESKVSGVLFTETMLARDDTIKVNGHKIDTENWNKAEEIFRDAAEELEDGDSDDAKFLGKDAELMYRKAELKAIQTKFLKETWRNDRETHARVVYGQQPEREGAKPPGAPVCLPLMYGCEQSSAFPCGSIVAGSLTPMHHLLDLSDG